jgi:hypothetical protein
MKKSRIWTKEEDDFLRNNFKDMTVKEMTNFLDRTEGAIKKRILALEIKPKRNAKRKPRYEGDSETHKTCRRCLRILPKTLEYFGGNGGNGKAFKPYCRECLTPASREAKILKEMEREEKEKNDFFLFISQKKYLCKKCNQEKLGKEMKVDFKKKYVASICRECNSKRTSELAREKIIQLDFSLKKGEKKNG